MNVAKIAVEASKILKDYPYLSYEQAIQKAKEVIDYEVDRRRTTRTLE